MRSLRKRRSEQQQESDCQFSPGQDRVRFLVLFIVSINDLAGRAPADLYCCSVYPVALYYAVATHRRGGKSHHPDPQ
jgi:hypothetical protein